MSEPTPRVTVDELSFGGYFASDLEQHIAEFAAAVVRADGVDPVITEIVRLRCAQIHDCRLCGSLRSRNALDAGFDEVMQKKIGAWASSDFDARTKAALALCDAMILTPGHIDPALRATLAEHFDERQVAELCIDIMKWGQQKALVALRVEPALSTDHLTEMLFDEDGHPVFGEAIGA